MSVDYFAGNHFSMAGSSPKNTKRTSNQPMFYGVQYNHEGKFWLRVDKKYEYKLEGPHAFITHPGAFFEYGPIDSEPRHHNYICFHGPRVQNYIDGGLLVVDAIPRVIKINHPDKFLRTMQKIINIVFDEHNNDERAVLMLEDLLLQMHEQERNTPLPKPHQTPYLSSLMSEIHLHPDREINWEQAAAELNVSLVHFRRLFKHYCGLAPQQFLIQQRLRKAADMLVNTPELIRDIAEAIGIDNEFYFSRLFKKKYQISPECYRKEFIGEEIQG